MLTKTADILPASPNQIIGRWLLIICTMVFAMVVIGGFTRLTESGLSMTDWHPVTGWLPPLSEAAWQAQFDAYRRSPEYNQINAGMSLFEFKEIFWLEYLHRLFGRIIGLAFAVPFAVFAIKGWLRGADFWRMAGLLVLGGMQGVIGWWMVKSGLIDRPDVSQYRLALHLGMAFVILGAVLWCALSKLESPRQQAGVGLRRAATILPLAVLVTVLSGALVAGLNAGKIYNTFPLMLGEFFPSVGFQLSPWYLNFFEDIPTVQFDHRWLAISTFFLAVVTWRLARLAGGDLAKRGGVVLIAAAAQVLLGIATLLHVVPIPLAAAHQAGAVILFASALWLRHGIAGPSPDH